MATVNKLGGNWIIVRSHTTVASDEIGAGGGLAGNRVAVEPRVLDRR